MSQHNWNGPHSRRSLLRLIGAAGCAAVGLPLLVGCEKDGGGSDDGPVTIERAELESAGRVTVRWQEQPVEVRATDAGVEARSLVCTHMGCTVHWEAAQDRYVCPCHKGMFDSRGEPIEGPPPAALRSVPVQVNDATIIVGT